MESMETKRCDLVSTIVNGFDVSSPSLSDSRPMVRFLYTLCRDHLPIGVVENLVRQALEPVSCTYSNGMLCRYAQMITAEFFKEPKSCIEQKVMLAESVETRTINVVAVAAAQFEIIVSSAIVVNNQKMIDDYRKFLNESFSTLSNS